MPTLKLQDMFDDLCALGDANEILTRGDDLGFRRNLAPLTDEVLTKARTEGRP